MHQNVWNSFRIALDSKEVARERHPQVEGLYFPPAVQTAMRVHREVKKVGHDYASELRAAIDSDGIPGNPARIVGGEKSDDATDVVRLGNSLQRLHAERGIASRVRFGQARHVSRDDAGRHG